MGFSCFACNDEMSSVVEPPDIEDLNQMGKQFMKQFKESADWMGTWQFLNQEGVLEVNNVIMHSTSHYGIHYLVPILNTKGVVDKIVLFPLNITPENVRGDISFKAPVIISNTEIKSVSIFRDVFDNSVCCLLRNTGLNVNSNFLVNEETAISRAGQRTVTYLLYFVLAGESQIPWKEDVGFLENLLKLYQNTIARSSFDHYMQIQDNCIKIVFRNLSTNVSTVVLDPYIDDFMLRLTHYLPEVVVQNFNRPWMNFESSYSDYDMNSGVYLFDPPQSVQRLLQVFIPPAPPAVPRRQYQSRAGEKMFTNSDFPRNGNKDITNKRCVVNSIEYGLGLLGDQQSAEYLWNEYLVMLGVNYYEGVRIDRSFTSLLTLHFRLSPVINKNYKALIDSGKPIIAFLPMNITGTSSSNELHCVIVVGYNSIDGWLIYYNPTTGNLHEAPKDCFVRDDVSYGLGK